MGVQPVAGADSQALASPAAQHHGYGRDSGSRGVPPEVFFALSFDGRMPRGGWARRRCRRRFAARLTLAAPCAGSSPRKKSPAVPGVFQCADAQRWMTINIPATSPSDAMIMFMWLNFRPNRVDSPMTMNQMPARKTPMPFK